MKILDSQFTNMITLHLQLLFFFFFIFLALYSTCSVGIIYCVHFAKKQTQRVGKFLKGGIFYRGERGPIRCRAGGFLSTLHLCQRPAGEPLRHMRAACLQRALATPAKANQEYRHGFPSAEINPSAASSVVVGNAKMSPASDKSDATATSRLISSAAAPGC